MVEAFAGDLSDAAAARGARFAGFPTSTSSSTISASSSRSRSSEISDADWLRFFEVNVLSGVRLSRAVSAADARAQLGPDRFHLQRIGVQIPAEMIHYGMTKTAQLAVARGLAETLRRHRRHRELRAAGPDRLRRRRTSSSRSSASRAADRRAQVEKEFFERARPTSLLKRFATPDEVAAHGRLRLQPARLRHDRRRAARRRRRRPLPILIVRRLRKLDLRCLGKPGLAYHAVYGLAPVGMAGLRLSEARTSPVRKRFLIFGETVHQIRKICFPYLQNRALVLRKRFFNTRNRSPYLHSRSADEENRSFTRKVAERIREIASLVSEDVWQPAKIASRAQKTGRG